MIDSIHLLPSPPVATMVGFPPLPHHQQRHPPTGPLRLSIASTGSRPIALTAQRRLTQPPYPFTVSSPGTSNNGRHSGCLPHPLGPHMPLATTSSAPLYSVLSDKRVQLLTLSQAGGLIAGAPSGPLRHSTPATARGISSAVDQRRSLCRC